MSKGLVLVSGVNGYIAAVTAKQLLDAGYSVRGTVRKTSSAQPLVEGPLKEYADAGKFTVVEVPDITVDRAFDEAVKDVTVIAHLASPVSFHFSDPDPVIHAAVNGTKSILASALKAGPQLKSFILLSSIVAIRTLTPAPYAFTEKDWNDWAEAKVAELGKNAPGPVIYSASKTASEKAFWAVRNSNKPSFTMTAINPVFVIGPPLVPPKSPSAVGETILPIWTIFSGAPYPTSPQPNLPISGIGPVVDVRDVASLINYAIEHAQQTDGERYIASNAVSTAQSIADVLRKEFPDARGRIVEGTPGQGYSADYQPVKGNAQVPTVDSGKARGLLGDKGWIGYEKSIVDTAESFKALL